MDSNRRRKEAEMQTKTDVKAGVDTRPPGTPWVT